MNPDLAPLGEPHDVVLFDGVCNLCNAAVLFIIDRDPHARIRFAALQSDVGRRVLERAGRAGASLDTMVFIENGRYFDRSTAALRIARRLRGAWPLLALALAIPRPVRDAVYDVIARNRYRWFGRETQCRVPTASLRSRFLDQDHTGSLPA